MTDTDFDRIVKDALYAVAPDLESEPIDPDLPFNLQFEFDSMDFLNFVIGLNRATGLALPEKDYPRLTTLASASAYLAGKLAARKTE
jgi:acyl carrier protein